MKLHQLLKQVTFKDVMDSINHWYWNQADSEPGYKKLFLELLNKEPVVNPDGLDTIVLTLHKETMFETESQKLPGYINVTAKNNSDLTDKLDYGLDFVPRNEWLSMAVEPPIDYQLSLSDMVGHILWEMTFYGFDERDVEKQKEKIMDNKK